MEKLSGDETIRDIIGSLAKPENYVRGVLSNMAEFRRRDIEPIVRIGTTGQGIYPHYCLEPADRHDADPNDQLKALDQYCETLTAFNGRNHKPMEWSFMEIRGEHWSNGFMSFDEVQSLLGELRGYRGKNMIKA